MSDPIGGIQCSFLFFSFLFFFWLQIFAVFWKMNMLSQISLFFEERKSHQEFFILKKNHHNCLQYEKVEYYSLMVGRLRCIQVRTKTRTFQSLDHFCIWFLDWFRIGRQAGSHFSVVFSVIDWRTVGLMIDVVSCIWVVVAIWSDKKQFLVWFGYIVDEQFSGQYFRCWNDQPTLAVHSIPWLLFIM
jgi:hypothetical protein